MSSARANLPTPCFRKALTTAGVFAAHPTAFAIVFFYVRAWLLLSLDTFDWHAVATVTTWRMTLIMQRVEHLDTQSIHARLDELLKTNTRARNELTLLDRQEPEVVESTVLRNEKSRGSAKEKAANAKQSARRCFR
jgi:low affinity Fe/Cu permease